MRVHANLIWLQLSDRLAELVAADPKLKSFVAARLDAHVFAVRPEHYRALRQVLLKRGLAPEEVGAW